ncbi:MAG: hypothetical protein AAFZ80_02395 [Cyanobacteria bacterium P01_A01_bin.105]
MTLNRYIAVATKVCTRGCARAYSRRRATGLGALLLCLGLAAPSAAHRGDLAAAKVVVGESEAKISLTYPTRFSNFADTDGNGQLSAREVSEQTDAVVAFFAENIRLQDHGGQLATLASVQPLETDSIVSAQHASTNGYTTLNLVYTWPAPVAGVVVDYQLFDPTSPHPSCLVTVVQGAQLESHVLTPENATLTIILDEQIEQSLTSEASLSQPIVSASGMAAVGSAILAQSVT